MTLESASSMNKDWPNPHLQLMHKPPPEMLAVELHCGQIFVALKSRFRDVPLSGPLQVDLVVAVHQLLEWDLSFLLIYWSPSFDL